MTKTFQAPQEYEKGDAPSISLSPVESSQVQAVGYDPLTNTLAVKFKRGDAAYHYPGVTPEQHQAFLKAESIGRHFDQHIRPLAFRKYRLTPLAA